MLGKQRKEELFAVNININKHVGDKFLIELLEQRLNEQNIEQNTKLTLIMCGSNDEKFTSQNIKIILEKFNPKKIKELTFEISNKNRTKIGHKVRVSKEIYNYLGQFVSACKKLNILILRFSSEVTAKEVNDFNQGIKGKVLTVRKLCVFAGLTTAFIHSIRGTISELNDLQEVTITNTDDFKVINLDLAKLGKIATKIGHKNKNNHVLENIEIKNLGFIPKDNISDLIKVITQINAKNLHLEGFFAKDDPVTLAFYLLLATLNNPNKINLCGLSYICNYTPISKYNHNMHPYCVIFPRTFFHKRVFQDYNQNRCYSLDIKNILMKTRILGNNKCDEFQRNSQIAFKEKLEINKVQQNYFGPDFQKRRRYLTRAVMVVKSIFTTVGFVDPEIMLLVLDYLFARWEYYHVLRSLLEIADSTKLKSTDIYQSIISFITSTRPTKNKSKHINIKLFKLNLQKLGFYEPFGKQCFFRMASTGSIKCVLVDKRHPVYIFIAIFYLSPSFSDFGKVQTQTIFISELKDKIPKEYQDKIKILSLAVPEKIIIDPRVLSGLNYDKIKNQPPYIIDLLQKYFTLTRYNKHIKEIKKRQLDIYLYKNLLKTQVLPGFLCDWRHCNLAQFFFLIIEEYNNRNPLKNIEENLQILVGSYEPTSICSQVLQDFALLCRYKGQIIWLKIISLMWKNNIYLNTVIRESIKSIEEKNKDFFASELMQNINEYKTAKDFYDKGIQFDVIKEKLSDINTKLKATYKDNNPPKIIQECYKHAQRAYQELNEALNGLINVLKLIKSDKRKQLLKKQKDHIEKCKNAPYNLIRDVPIHKAKFKQLPQESKCNQKKRKKITSYTVYVPQNKKPEVYIDDPTKYTKGF